MPLAPVVIDPEVVPVEAPANRVSTDAKWINFRLLMNVTIVGLAYGLYAYDNSFVTPLVSLPLFVLKYQGGTVPTFTAINLDLLISVPLIGAALGVLVGTPLQQRVGRKRGLLVGYFTCCLPGSVLQLFAPNLAALVVGRLWNNFGVAILTSVCPLYMADLVPPHVRARTVGFALGISQAISIVAVTLVWGTERLKDSRQYKIPLALQGAIALVLGLLTWLCTESPAWLVSKGRIDEALQSMAALRCAGTNVGYEIEQIRQALEQDHERRKRARFWDIFAKSEIKRTFVASVLAPASQVGGQILVLSFATPVLIQSGIQDPFKITILITTLQFAGICVGPSLLDKVGRRPVALVGFTVLAILDFAIAGLAFDLTSKARQNAFASLCIIFGFVNSMSFQALLLLLPTEVPTARLREPTVSWTLFWSYVTAIVTTFAVPQLTGGNVNLGAKTDFIFGGCMIITLVLTYWYLPETRGRSMVEIDEMYRLDIPPRRWRNYKCDLPPADPAIEDGDVKMESEGAEIMSSVLEHHE